MNHRNHKKTAARKMMAVLLVLVMAVLALAPVSVMAEPTGNDSGSGTQQPTTGGGGSEGGTGGGQQTGGGSEQPTNGGGGTGGSTGGSQQTEESSGSQQKEEKSEKKEQESTTYDSSEKTSTVTYSTGNYNAGNDTGVEEQKEQPKNIVSLAFTSDIHSYLDGTNDAGLARVQTKLDEIRKDYDATCVLDAGNFSMGTVFQTIYQKSASELKTLGAMEYDAVAIGPSEFDYGAKGLASMLSEAADDKEMTKTREYKYNKSTYRYETVTTFKKTMPEVVCAGINWQKSLKKKDASDAEALQKAWRKYGVQDYTIIEKNGVKIAVMSVMGDSAVDAAQGQGVSFRGQVARAQEIVDEIKTNGEADMIVCLTPDNGNNDISTLSENKKLASSVDGIDVIITGSGLKEMKEPVKKGDTYIVGVKGNSTQVGQLVLKKGKGNTYSLKKYKVYDITKKVDEDASIESTVSGYASQVTSDYLTDYGFSYNERLADNDVSFPPIEELNNSLKESTLGDLISDSYIDAVKDAEGSDYQKVDVSFVSAANIRSDLAKGEVTSTDAYDVNGGGIGLSNTAGYPIVTMYVTGKDLKRIAELYASVGDKDSRARFFTSGLHFKVNTHRIYLNRAYDIKLDLGNGNYESIKNRKLYRVATGLGELNDLKSRESIGYGVLKITPKTSDGKKVSDMDSLVLKHHHSEVKTWQAMADYIDTMSGDTIGTEYASAQGRIDDETGFHPVSLFSGPNQMAVIAVCLFGIIVILIVGLVFLIRQFMYNRRGFEKPVFKTKKKEPTQSFKPRNHNLVKKSKKRKRWKIR